LEAEARKRYISPYNRGLILLALGEREKAMELLESAFDTKDIRMVFLHVEPRWEPLRDDQRFQSLLRKMSLPAL
jgi:hypothetical protein